MSIHVERAFVATFVLVLAMLASAGSPAPIGLALVALILIAGMSMMGRMRPHR